MSIIERSSVCLNMIVRDEAHVIARCLKSCLPHIDHFVIVDTGSTDDTKKIILNVLKDIDGEVIDRPWKDFGHNRTEALELAKGKADYILIIDADDELVGGKPLHLTHDAYSLNVYDGPDAASVYNRPHILKDGLPWRYVGRLHEYLTCDQPFQKVLLTSLKYLRHPAEGARSREGLTEKFKRDAEVFEQQIREEPNSPDHARHVYYLGQSYKDAGMKEKAIEAFEKRVTLKGWEEESYIALYYLAEYVLKEEEAKEKIDFDRVEKAYLRAFEHRPSRAEAICTLCAFLNEHEEWERSFQAGKLAIDKPLPMTDIWLVQHNVYQWKMLDVFGIAAFYAGHYTEALDAYRRLAARSTHDVPESERARIVQNMKFCEEKIHGSSAIEGSAEWKFKQHEIAENQTASGFGPFLDQLKKNIANGGTELGTQLTLFSLAVSIRAETVVEIGRFRGASTYALANAMRFLKAGWKEVPEAHQRPEIDYAWLESTEKDWRLFSIEIDPKEPAKALIRDNGLEGFVTFVDKPSSEVSSSDLDERKIDLCFIDGDHSYQGCMDDVLRFTPMIREGGYFILHDYVGWISADGKNGSPIKKVCDAIADDFEHILIDTSYMSFMIFRKRDKVTARSSVPSPAAKSAAPISVPRIAKKYWRPNEDVIRYVEKLIEPGWKVLEIGPGAIPFSKATHFVDRPNEGGQFTRRDNTSYLDVNFDRLPFEDKSFDFVYSRHCVEDLFNPDLLLKEMGRVGKRGYIETPSALVETTRGVDGGADPKHRGYIHHRWVLWEVAGELHFVEKATCIEHMDLPDHSGSLSDPVQWNMYFFWNGELRFHHLQHDIDFRLHVDYDRVLEGAVGASIASAKSIARRIR